MKTKEELAVLKEEYKTLNRKLAELTDEELYQVTGGNAFCMTRDTGKKTLDPDNGIKPFEIEFVTHGQGKGRPRGRKDIQ